MKVLVVGSGGREHAIVWKLAQCKGGKKAEKIFCAPGNAGIAKHAECVPIGAEDIPALLDFSRKNEISLAIVGPEAPLVAGIADEFEKAGISVFGPGAKAAEIEGSKIFAKQLMQKYKIPTAEFAEFSNAEKAIDHVHGKTSPCVVKANGLAAGKGVMLCSNAAEAEAAIKKIMVDKEFGTAGEKIVIEEMLQGQEATILAFTDGTTVIPMSPSQDHKRIFDNDNGQNTGGMGAYSPAPVVTEKLQQQITEKILQPTVRAMKREHRTYKGVLYAGLMITKEGPKVLEFNARFGDPETQVVLPRLESDLLPIAHACVGGTLSDAEVKWRKEAATCVVLASAGYPGKYEKGREISGLAAADAMEGVAVFHAGTKSEGGKILTSGGRVLGVTALGGTIRESISRAYAAVEKIKFEGMQYRRDIGRRALGQ